MCGGACLRPGAPIRRSSAGDSAEGQRLGLTSVTPAALADTVARLVTEAAERRGVPGVAPDPTDVALERPRNREHGDWASNVAMRFAKRFGVPPRELATELADGIAA